MDSTEASAGMPVRTGWLLTSLTNMMVSLRIQQASRSRLTDPVLWQAEWTANLTVAAGLCRSATEVEDQAVIEVMQVMLLAEQFSLSSTYRQVMLSMC